MLRLMRVRAMTAADWPSVERIYRQGIDEGEATFEIATPSWEVFEGGRPAALRWVAVDAAESVRGWAAASPVSARPAYRGVVEHSVYVDREARGAGVGRMLLDAVIAAAEAADIWTVQSSIFPENAASLRLHEAAGFRIVGRRERIARSGRGAHAGRWRDTILIERRSAVAGVD
jgi:L-amino acid N-acyltransferase YncA